MDLAAFALAACLSVGASSDQVLAGDLAAAFPAWAAVPPATPLGLAPAPGVQRVFRLPELRRLAARWNVTPLPDQSVCVTRPVAACTAGRLLAAMQKEIPGARIDLLDFSRQPSPEGELLFPASGLRQTPAGGYWSGYVRYGGNHRFVLWARVRVVVAVARVVAARDLKADLALEAAAVRVETREEVAGKATRRAIAAGTALRSEWLEPAKVVRRGDTVQVEAVRGGARLQMECVAEASGAIGETIPIQNPVSKHSFPARVESKGKVVVTKGSL